MTQEAEYKDEKVHELPAEVVSTIDGYYTKYASCVKNSKFFKMLGILLVMILGIWFVCMICVMAYRSTLKPELYILAEQESRINLCDSDKQDKIASESSSVWKLPNGRYVEGSTAEVFSFKAFWRTLSVEANIIPNISYAPKGARVIHNEDEMNMIAGFPEVIGYVDSVVAYNISFWMISLGIGALASLIAYMYYEDYRKKFTQKVKDYLNDCGLIPYAWSTTKFIPEQKIWLEEISQI